ncbi:hypothetical protein PT300_15255 [Enterobacteriaceae bacterium ESL0689]|nr:hypothetical protein [Enterobacteriaceae bacterium ESL0689]
MFSDVLWLDPRPQDKVIIL